IIVSSIRLIDPLDADRIQWRFVASEMNRNVASSKRKSRKMEEYPENPSREDREEAILFCTPLGPNPAQLMENKPDLSLWTSFLSPLSGFHRNRSPLPPSFVQTSTSHHSPEPVAIFDGFLCSSTPQSSLHRPPITVVHPPIVHFATTFPSDHD